MELVIDPNMIWNLFLTLVIAPVGLIVRNVMSEQKRIDILLNKTREEIARDYLTRDQIEKDFQRLFDTMNRMDEKLDRLQSKTYFQE
jgi:sensor histidine kinase YesM|tara:strand:+ start:4569 stop:4829 length:261 start_codon:yes stop_codon:yes gene_type:complete